MEEMYGLPSSPEDYSDKAIMTPDNLIFPADYQSFLMSSSAAAAGFRDRIPVLGSEELLSAASAITEVEASVAAPEFRPQEDSSSVIKARIASHPNYPRLIQAYIDCQKVGAPPEIACFLDEIRRENDLNKRDVVSTCFGDDRELDEFMETYCDVLLKYKSDLARPFDEATSFLNKIETQLTNLCSGASLLSLPAQRVIGKSYHSHMHSRRFRWDMRQLFGSQLNKTFKHLPCLALSSPTHLCCFLLAICSLCWGPSRASLPASVFT
ncbi:homeobox protein knotted-1-like 6 isoform X2 [Prosopis cineraria]|uniref:homeobox protein knotted-1-like 6 isoform X2 n=1 Tax=Prosopis cineraria TaxID=364024 RepID=UPI00240ED6A6|nr:homeobox protein knotted-1-like 6 isoform X2 [Prosopis cineraria]